MKKIYLITALLISCFALTSCGFDIFDDLYVDDYSNSPFYYYRSYPYYGYDYGNSYNFYYYRNERPLPPPPPRRIEMPRINNNIYYNNRRNITIPNRQPMNNSRPSYNGRR